jgi:hypothetical protein
VLNSILINPARIKFRDHAVTVMYERVNVCSSRIKSDRSPINRSFFFSNFADPTLGRVGEVSGKPTDFSSAKLVKNRPISRRPVDLMYGVAGEKATGRRQIGRFFPNFADPTKVGSA